jgi:CDP-diacylglycerol--glycerol-3-phosphate 3-phosphatidyltransferase
MIKEKFGDRLDGWLHAAIPFVFRRPINPNLLTVIGTLVSLVAAAAFASGAFAWAGVLVLAGGFFDLIDGVVGRHHGTSTRFGAFLDSTLDRLVDMALLLGIALYFARIGRPDVVLLAGVALIATVLVSYSKACAERYVDEIKVGVLERGERIGLIAAGGILGLVEPALWVVAIGSVVTVIQRFNRSYREMEKADAEERLGLGERA